MFISRWHRVIAALSCFTSSCVVSASYASIQIQITPSTMPQWVTNSNSNPTTQDLVKAIMGDDAPMVDLVLRYKSNDGSSNESGTHATSYETEFEPPGDPIDADIMYVTTFAGPVIQDAVKLLVVKDGNHTPAVYVFDISSWDGLGTIGITGFWPRQGAISNVAIWGGETVVPEAASLIVWSLLMGSAGFASARRRREG